MRLFWPHDALDIVIIQPLLRKASFMGWGIVLLKYKGVIPVSEDVLNGCHEVILQGLDICHRSNFLFEYDQFTHTMVTDTRPDHD